MGFTLVKTLISALIITMVSEIAKRSPAFAALIASLPLVSVLGMIWIYSDSNDVQRLAAHSEATFWFVLPSLPMFLVLPLMLRHGVGFYLALALNCAMTAVLYLAMVRVGAHFGLKF
jgi:inner membrane protein involved in colicin E2 resistance